MSISSSAGQHPDYRFWWDSSDQFISETPPSPPEDRINVASESILTLGSRLSSGPAILVYCGSATGRLKFADLKIRCLEAHEADRTLEPVRLEVLDLCIEPRRSSGSKSREGSFFSRVENRKRDFLVACVLPGAETAAEADVEDLKIGDSRQFLERYPEKDTSCSDPAFRNDLPMAEYLHEFGRFSEAVAPQSSNTSHQTLLCIAHLQPGRVKHSLYSRFLQSVSRCRSLGIFSDNFSAHKESFFRVLDSSSYVSTQCDGSKLGRRTLPQIDLPPVRLHYGRCQHDEMPDAPNMHCDNLRPLGGISHGPAKRLASRMEMLQVVESQVRRPWADYFDLLFRWPFPEDRHTLPTVRQEVRFDSSLQEIRLHFRPIERFRDRLFRRQSEMRICNPVASLPLLFGSKLSDFKIETSENCGDQLASDLLCSPVGTSSLLPSINEQRLLLVLGELVHVDQLWLRDTVRRCLGNLEQCSPLGWRQTSLGWREEERWSFFMDRALSFPEAERNSYSAGLSALGGFVQGLGFAWFILYSSLARREGLDISLSDLHSHGLRGDRGLVDFAKALAQVWGLEVKDGSAKEMDAFLVRTKRRSVIYLKQDLDPRRKAFSICHELAHYILKHQPNTSYCLDSRRLSVKEIASFELQESAADALASLWIHLLEGLLEVGRVLMRAGGALIVSFSQQRRRYGLCLDALSSMDEQKVKGVFLKRMR